MKTHIEGVKPFTSKCLDRMEEAGILHWELQELEQIVLRGKTPDLGF